MSNLIAFSWYGGKYSHLNWLLPILPKAHHYCEPFGGSAAVLLNREPSPIETYNDIYGEVVNFFQILRNQPDLLIKAISLTPFSRKEFEIALSNENTSDLERARRFFIRARQVRTGLAQKATIGRWAYCKLTSRSEMSGSTSRWLGSVKLLPQIVQRLERVQFENAPAIEVIKRYDTPKTLFYCDPPYPHESRRDSTAYAYEMSDSEHRILAKVLHSVKGNVVLSGYRCSLMEELYSDWNCIEGPLKKCHSAKQPRCEAVWINFEKKFNTLGNKN